ncbi:ATG16-domain-containing protein [Fistulina hepatica ATCC 64428]|uniref:ATG16-domain-containing protein n=1 Tax=Fistulina hepatica ATCC 64428 TaxID=1128425 RepID=A0A0D7A3T1_9AGAR|nr:ATG16-domain-containing protein [Fistulina hepatica ATCC 64428]
MAEPVWQEQLRLRLVERNARESAFAPIIEQYRRLAQQTALLKERNATLLKASGALRGNASSSTLNSSSVEDNPVSAAYMASLESQISTLRDELGAVYKTQGQNAQRLLAMNETLREREEVARLDGEAIRKARDELAVLRRKVNEHKEQMTEKDRAIQILNDEISALQLELGQIEERNQILSKDNAKLLQRWLDAKQADAQKMNEANVMYEEMRSKHDELEARTQKIERNGADASAPDSPSVSGNEEAGEGSSSHLTSVKDGTPSPAKKTMTQTPNG